MKLKEILFKLDNKLLSFKTLFIIFTITLTFNFNITICGNANSNKKYSSKSQKFRMTQTFVDLSSEDYLQKITNNASFVLNEYKTKCSDFFQIDTVIIDQDSLDLIIENSLEKKEALVTIFGVTNETEDYINSFLFYDITKGKSIDFKIIFLISIVVPFITFISIMIIAYITCCSCSCCEYCVIICRKPVKADSKISTRWKWIPIVGLAFFAFMSLIPLLRSFKDSS